MAKINWISNPTFTNVNLFSTIAITQKKNTFRFLPFDIMDEVVVKILFIQILTVIFIISFNN